MLFWLKITSRPPSDSLKNQLFKSQMEALMVAFELIWKLAKASFVDPAKEDLIPSFKSISSYASMLSGLFTVNTFL